MVLLPAVAGGDLLWWAVFVVLGALALAFRKLIRTLATIARVELWAWFSKRHRDSGKDVRKLIEQSSQADLQEQPSLWRRPGISK